jgi:CRISPR-associated endonuclease/helicase Cas3
MGRHPSKIVAKSYNVPFPKGLNGYRHELGSVVSEKEGDDLLLHLIAAHHGHARPHFTPKAIDGRNIRGSERVIRETPARFARLTEQYGPWGLAYLEAILKAADAWASRGEPEDNA